MGLFRFILSCVISTRGYGRGNCSAGCKSHVPHREAVRGAAETE
jgi:hypothetical protein